jgi:cytochrome c
LREDRVRRFRRSALAIGILLLGIAGPPPTWAQARTDPSRGEALFDDVCSSCHIRAGGGLAPTLVGVVGRPAASQPGAIYSRALRASGLVWTPANLDLFLTDPAALAPGTAMPISIADQQARADMIAFLASTANKP